LPKLNGILRQLLVLVFTLGLDWDEVLNENSIASLLGFISKRHAVNSIFSITSNHRPVILKDTSNLGRLYH
jgi:hypothetical protein